MQNPIKHRQAVVVRVSRSAFLDMAVAAIEAAVVPPLLSESSEKKAATLDLLRRRQPNFDNLLPLSLLFSSTGLPVSGILVGREYTDDVATTFEVDRMFVGSAGRHDFGIWPSPLSACVMAEIIQTAGANFEVVGDFMSRPLLTQTLLEIESSQSYRLTREIGTAPEFEGDRVSLVMTITGAKDRIPSTSARPKSVSQHSFGKWELWLAAMLRDRRSPTQGPELLVEAPLTWA